MLRPSVLALGLTLFLTTAPAMAAPSPPVAAADSETARITLTPASLAGFPRRSVTAVGHDGVKATYEGVELHHLLTKAGFPLGPALRGRNVSAYVIATAADGYQVAFALAELDPAFRDDVVLLADTRDGKPLNAEEGPLRLVIPAEKRPARWIRQVRSLSLHLAQGE